MYTARKALLLLIPFGIFVLASIALSYYEILDIGSQAILAMIALYVIAQVVRFASSYARARRSQRERAVYQGVITRLGVISGMPTLLPDSPISRTRNAEDLATQFLWEALSAQKVDTKVIVEFIEPRQIFSYPEGQSCSKSFVSEVRDHYLSLKEPGTILWSGPSLFGRIVSKEPKISPVLEIEEPSVSRLAYRYEIASQEFGDKFCLTMPLLIDSYKHGTSSSTRITGYVGFLSQSSFTPSVASHIETVGNRFNALYSRVRVEQLAMLIDDILNYEAFSELNAPGSSAVAFLGKQLKEVIQRSFKADRVELWLRGTPCDHSESICDVVDSMLQRGQSDIGTSAGGSIGGYNYHLDSQIELDRCALGFIRILRNKVAFTEFEVELLRGVERSLDNYIRDMWAHSVLRRIDGDVLNKAHHNISTFTDELIKKIVSELGVTAGLIEVSQHSDSFYVAPGNDPERLKTAFIGLRKQCKSAKGAVLDMNSGFENCQYLFVPIGMAPAEPIGAVYIANFGKLTNIHLQILKRIESHIDNILQLYLNLSRS